MCNFGAIPETLPLAELIIAVSGWDFTMEEGLKTGRRIQTLRQCFNIREGVNTREWKLPDRLIIPQSEGPNQGREIDLEAMKRKGYEVLGWDPRTGRPLDSTIEELGLKGIVAPLVKI